MRKRLCWSFTQFLYLDTGEGLELVRLFYSLLPQRQRWHERSEEATQFLIDETFRCPPNSRKAYGQEAVVN